MEALKIYMWIKEKGKILDSRNEVLGVGGFSPKLSPGRHDDPEAVNLQERSPGSSALPGASSWSPQ